MCNGSVGLYREYFPGCDDVVANIALELFWFTRDSLLSGDVAGYAKFDQLAGSTSIQESGFLMSKRKNFGFSKEE